MLDGTGSIRIVAMATVRCGGERLRGKGAEEARKVDLSSRCAHTCVKAAIHKHTEVSNN